MIPLTAARSSHRHFLPDPRQPDRHPRRPPGGGPGPPLQLFLSINSQPTDSPLFKSTVAGLGSGTVKMLKADDHAYDELRKIPAAIGIQDDEVPEGRGQRGRIDS